MLQFSKDAGCIIVIIRFGCTALRQMEHVKHLMCSHHHLHLKQISIIYCGETWFTRGLSRGPADARLDCSSHQSTLQQTRLMGINMPELKKGKGWIQPRAENTARCVRMSRKLWGIFKELCLLWQKILSCFIQRPCIARALWLFRRGKKQTSWIKMLDCETGPGRWQRSAG